MSAVLTKPQACPVREHVSALHELAEGIDGVFVVSVVYANTSGPKDAIGSVTHHRVGDVAGMTAAITAHAGTPNANTYTGLHLMRPDIARGARGTEADIVAVLGLIADMDADTGKVGELPLEPSFIIETSPGNRQPGWLFAGPLPRDEAVPIAKALQRATASDFGTGDVSHIWRIPGTWNWPNKKKLDRGRSPDPVAVTMLQPFGGDLIDAADLWKAVQQFAVAPSEQRAVSLGELPTVDGIDVSFEVADMLATNDVLDRSRHAATIVEKMGFEGLTAEEGAALFFNASGDWRERYKTHQAMKKDFARLWGRFAQDDTPYKDPGVMIKTGLAKTAAPSPHPMAANDNDIPDREHELTKTVPLSTLTRPGGVLQDMVDWIVSSAEQPSRELALAAVLPFLGTLMGRRYSTSNRGTRANLYTVALAESGFGKEHARTQLKRVVSEADKVFDGYYGASRIMSASGLRGVLEANPSQFLQIDEFGGFIRDITDKNAGSHQKAISTDLRDYYSASSTFFEGASYAGKKAVKIYNPCLCIHGTSTPLQFWNAVSSASAEDGLLPRMMLFDIKGPKPKTVEPTSNATYVPSFLLEKLAQIAGINVAKARLGGKGGAASWTEPRTLSVDWTKSAHDRFNLLRTAVEEEETLLTPEAQPFIRRILETATKLALIAAVSVDHDKPEIDRREMEWACDLAWSTAATMISQVSERLSDTPREAAYKKLYGIIKAAGPAGITPGKLADRCRGLPKQLRTELISDLRDSGHISEIKEATAGRPKHRFVWVP